MPVLAAPAYLVAALAASLVVVALHLLAWRRPRPTPLPTARFAPPSAVRALSRDLRLSDALLMMMRVAALLLAGLALARPAVQPRRVGVARVILVDASRRVSSIAEARDSARAHAGGADAVSWIRVDSSPAIVSDSALGERAEVRGRLGSGMVAAIREATRLAETHEQVSIVVVSPFAAESWDAGMEAMRGVWRGEVVAVRVGARATEASEGAAPARAAGAGGDASRELPPPSDPLGAAFALALDRSAPAIRVRREPPGAGDSAWVRDGGILVSWPRGQPADSGSAGETVPEVLTSGGRSVAGLFGRSASGVPVGSVILRWGDGAVAAVEQPMGRGCIRSVGVALPDAGDEVLRPGFLRLLRELAQVCGGGSAAVLDSGTIAEWARPAATDAEAPTSTAAGAAGAAGSASGAGIAGAAVAEGSAARAPSASERALQRWLLLAVAALLLAEWMVRRRQGVDTRRVDPIAPTEPREAA